MIGILFFSKDCQSFEPWTSNLGCRGSSRKTTRGDSQFLMTSQDTVEPDRGGRPGPAGMHRGAVEIFSA
jgi:hypothetical protein